LKNESTARSELRLTHESGSIAAGASPALMRLRNAFISEL
jgi:hypothetical protein